MLQNALVIVDSDILLSNPKIINRLAPSVKQILIPTVCYDELVLKSIESQQQGNDAISLKSTTYRNVRSLDAVYRINNPKTVSSQRRMYSYFGGSQDNARHSDLPAGVNPVSAVSRVSAIQAINASSAGSSSQIELAQLALNEINNKSYILEQNQKSLPSFSYLKGEKKENILLKMADVLSCSFSKVYILSNNSQLLSSKYGMSMDKL